MATINHDGNFSSETSRVAEAAYSAGIKKRRAFFAASFVWHVPGDTNLAGPYAGGAYFTEMPARMQPLDEWAVDVGGWC